MHEHTINIHAPPCHVVDRLAHTYLNRVRGEEPLARAVHRKDHDTNTVSNSSSNPLRCWRRGRRGSRVRLCRESFEHQLRRHVDRRVLPPATATAALGVAPPVKGIHESQPLSAPCGSYRFSCTRTPGMYVCTHVHTRVAYAPKEPAASAAAARLPPLVCVVARSPGLLPGHQQNVTLLPALLS